MEALARSREANLLEQQGRIADAERLWREVLAAGERFAGFARYRLVNLLERCGRVADAEREWREATAAGDALARVQLAVVLERQGRLDEAEQHGVTRRRPVTRGPRAVGGARDATHPYRGFLSVVPGLREVTVPPAAANHLLLGYAPCNPVLGRMGLCAWRRGT
jgi:hypothetical protein